MLEHLYQSPKKPARVVVLGAKGFVGNALVEHFKKSGVIVRAIGSAEIDLAAEAASERLAAALQGEDTVVFLSALTPDKGRGIPALQANIRMAAAVCAAIETRPPAQVVYISSDAVYPFRIGLINESSFAEPTDLYGVMHLSREIMVKQAGKAPVAILRPTLIYGAHDTHNSYGPNRLRRMARKDGKITVFGEGEETRDHIFIDDVVGLIDFAIRHRSSGTLNLATGQSISYADLAAKVARLFPTPIAVAGTPRQNPVTHRAFDVTAVRRAFPAFRFTPLDQGLALSHAGEAG